MKRRPFHGQLTSVVSHSRVFSWAMIGTPAFPRVSFEPVCSGCQWVLNSVRTGPAPGSAATAFSKAPEASADAPSTSTTPLAAVCATTLAAPGTVTTNRSSLSRTSGCVGRRLPGGGQETGRPGQSNAGRAAEGSFQEVPA